MEVISMKIEPFVFRKRRIRITNYIIISLVLAFVVLGNPIITIASESESTSIIITPINLALPLLPAITVAINSAGSEQESMGIVVAGSDGTALILRVSAAD